jgi:prepilin-type N-terminal cleavage/methylation domain-containing protein
MVKSGNKILIKGFTLVELLVVISIIAMLLAILLPSLHKAKEAASRVVCGKNLQQLGIASSAYFGDYNRFWTNYNMLSSSYHIYNAEETSSGLYRYWINHGLLLSLNYIKTAKIYYCPTSRRVKRRIAVTPTGNAEEFQSHKYEDYFAGDKILSSRVDDCVRCSYMCRSYDIVNGRVEILGIGGVISAGTGASGNPKTMGQPALVKISNPLRRQDGKLAIMADGFTFGLGGHLYRFYNVLYGDGSVKSYDDREQWLVAASDISNAYSVYTGKDFDDTTTECKRRFGNYLTAMTTNAPLRSWLFLDKR